MKTRADVVVRRTYARPHDDDETRFETWTEICERVACLYELIPVTVFHFTPTKLSPEKHLPYTPAANC